MQIVKLDLKLFATDRSSVVPSELIPVFHRWIQTSALDELLIDVADYGHVPDGPGVLLIGHDAHYSYDLADGRPGLLYSRRRETHPSLEPCETLAERLRSTLHRTLTAAVKLEAERIFGGRLAFRGDQFELTVNDRLAVAADPRGERTIRPHLETVLGELYTASRCEITTAASRPGTRLRLAVRADESATVGELLERLPTADCAESDAHLPVAAAGSGS